MLTFQQKIEILDSYPQLQRKDVSLGRVNYHYEESLHDKKTVAFHLHPNGNGYVYAGLLTGYETDTKGFVNIRDFSEEELRSLLDASITSLSEPQAKAVPAGGKKTKRLAAETSWINGDGQKLTLKAEDDLWYLYSGLSLEMAFETPDEAKEYLAEEGFSQAQD
ncbi:hypothetical protein SAMN04487895_11352 [Paenibacillus sophorae]|uniref:Uncharacterized protein n=1 Tax=Paenibacillus sophorae TaxID=1333845 RepID=A0A1H8T6B6_9BACL|nr:hypothetical protein [Paenibacillus sophorae]QWU17097.1 hypothetical protein KP014_07985 [Paenibacillus sophorae]SEO86023.1 hypothetical protein SAMN04487895_11352 [Paenibacillus sophorae]